MPWCKGLLGALAILVSLAAHAAGKPKAEAPLAGELSGEVVGVHDGDTVTLLTEERRFRVRLARIDAPELDQEFGDDARQALSTKVLGKRVRITTAGGDRYGRVLGEIRVMGRTRGHSINQTQVTKGWAWHYARYSDSKELAAAEKVARNRKLGLWAAPDPTPPWDWRKRTRGARRDARAHTSRRENESTNQ